MRQIILDTETTGLSPQAGHRLIEVGCLEMINRRLTGNNLHCYINPQRSIDKAAVDVHGITDQFVADKPLFADIYAELIEYLRGAELIIHNAPFDVGFLNYEMQRLPSANVTDISQICAVTDTLVMARRKHPGQHNSLDALCRRYHVDNSNRDLHGALLDAELLAQVYLLMTGGQTQLFVNESVNNSKSSNSERAWQRKPDQRLPVAEADAEALAAHQEFLTMMKQQGKCLWLEQNERVKAE